MKIDELLSGCMIADQFRLKKWLQKINKLTLPQQEKEKIRWQQAFDQSKLRKENRKINLPKIHYPDLPISTIKEDIISALNSSQIIIVAGETGSGKTTQLGKICLQAGLGINGVIGHTQPRRIAARTVALRIASELESSLGKFVGYKVRFSDKTQSENYIKIMTDGILLSETLQDKWLSHYDCLIIDEAHERSLNIDFLLGYIRNLISKRKDLKIIITSATINVARFSEYFNNAPIIEVSGRTFPVKVCYLNQDFHVESDDPILQVAKAVKIACKHGPGDILIFQSGEKEIKEVIEVLSNEALSNVLLLPLFSRQSNIEQQKVFQRASQRKIIVTTNVAETSLTVPNIRYVIDSGFARISRYNYRNKLQRLPIEPISQASCEQRKGRCGRVGPGICYRLYTQEDFLTRPLYTQPEILRTNLASVILKMLSLNLKNIEVFPFLDPPDNRFIKDGFSLLERLGAVDQDKQVTSLGRTLALVPIEPKLASILIAANQYGALNEILIIVSALSIVDVRERPQDLQAKADSIHAEFSHETSDFMTFLNLWNFIVKSKENLSHQKFRKLCKENFLSYLRVCEWLDVHNQLTQISQELGFRSNQIDADYSQIHKALLRGFIDTIGIKQDKKEYLGARNLKFYIHPASSLFKKAPLWIVASEIIHTTKTYARVAAQIEPLWIEEVAHFLLKKQFEEPYFDRNGFVVALEKALLFGLMIYNKRKVNYEKYAPLDARKIFIEQGLIQEQMQSNLPFYLKNKETKLKVIQLEDRIRRQKILFDESRLYQFYEERLPLNVCSIKSLEKFIKEKGSDKFLTYTEEDICYNLTDLSNLLSQYPESLTIKGQHFALAYQFDLTSLWDGVTLIVPLEFLKYIKEEDYSWLIPGLLEDKITYLIKSLPKSIRSQISVAATLEKAKKHLSKEPLSIWLLRFFKETFNLSLKENVFDVNLPAYLKMHFKIVDKNQILGQGDDLKEIYEKLKGDEFYSSEAFNKDNLTEWNFNDLPNTYQIKKGNLDFTCYPALQDKHNSVSIRLFDSALQAQSQHRYGLARLYLLYLHQTIKSIKKNITPSDKKALIKCYAPFGDFEQLMDELLLACALYLFIDGKKNIRSQAQFMAHLSQFRPLFMSFAQEMLKMVLHCAVSYQSLALNLNKLKEKPLYLEVCQDIEQQLEGLFEQHFIKRVPFIWLKRYPTYLKAIELRLAKLPRDLAQDKQAMLMIRSVCKVYESKLIAKDLSLRSPFDPLISFRWKIEEWRISCFAQALKTIEPVSKIRLLKQLETLS